MGGRGKWISEFKARLIYRVSFRTAKTTQRNPVSERKNKQKRERRNEEERKEGRKKKREKEKKSEKTEKHNFRDIGFLDLSEVIVKLCRNDFENGL